MTTPRDDRTAALPIDPGAPGPRPTGTGPHDVGPVRPTGAPDGVGRGPGRGEGVRAGGPWFAVLASIAVLLLLLVFILQNLTGATIHFLGASGTLPLGVALLLAAIAGAVLVALVGAARIMQLRRQAKRGLR